MLEKVNKVADNKIKFKFERNGLKLQVEFSNDDISSVIYNNFLDEKQTENVTFQEFRVKLEDYIDTIGIDSKEKLDQAVSRILEEINQSKLFSK